MIPFLDLKTQHRELRQALVETFEEALRHAAFIGGEQVEAFEAAFARFCGTEHCVGVSSGTDALRFALMASGVRPGDAVVTVPNTFIATSEAISQAGAVPVFVDVQASTLTLDPETLRAFLEEECHEGASGPVTLRNGSPHPVRAVVPVHLYGQPADMDPLHEIAAEYGLTVVEDACQAHGAAYRSGGENRWRRAGSLGRAAAFSFYAGKNLGACGEGGAVTTDDADIAATVRMLREHGQAEKYYHEMEGYNGRLDAIQAGILRVKLSRLDDWNEKRRAHARRYGSILKDVDGIVVPQEPAWARGVYHLYVIRTAARDALRDALNQSGIGTGLHYPLPLHRQKAYRHLPYGPGRFPVSERSAGEVLSLPMYPELTEEQIGEVCETIRRWKEHR